MPYLDEKLYLGRENRIWLIDSNLSGSDDYTVTITIVNAAGTVAKNDSDEDIQDKACSWDATQARYYYDVTFLTGTSAGFYRLFWTVLDSDSRQVDLLEYNSPQAARIVDFATFDRELVPVQWFLDDFLGNIDIGDYSIAQIREKIMSAQRDLEVYDVQTFFTPTTISNERHDFYWNRNFRDWWQTQLFHFPIYEMTSLNLKYGATQIAEVDTGYLQLDKEMGYVEVMPTSGGYFYTLITMGLQGIVHTLVGGFERIPLFFDFTYKAGLDWDNLGEGDQLAIMNAIGRKAAIDLLQKLDSRMGISSESKSMDGVSESTSYTSSAMYGQYSAQIEQYQKDHERWVDQFKRRYNKNLPMVSV